MPSGTDSTLKPITAIQKATPKPAQRKQAVVPSSRPPVADSSKLLQRAQDNPLALTSTALQRLASSAGPQAVQRLVNRPEVRRARTIQVPTPEFRPMAQLHGKEPAPSAPPSLQRISSAQAGVIQLSRLMPLDEVKRRKEAATKKTTFGFARSTGDIKEHYKKYDGFVASKKLDQALAELTSLRGKLARMGDKDYWKPGEKEPFLAAVTATIDNEQSWLQNEIGAKTGAEQQLGREREGRVAKGARAIAPLTMGQGLAVNLGQMILTSDEFSTCSPIVMFNSATHVGGLFHFPALGGLIRGGEDFEESDAQVRAEREANLKKQKPNLLNMYNKVRPTEIHLNNRSALWSETTSDVDPLRTFLTVECGFTGAIHVIVGSSASYSVTLADNNSVEIRTGTSHPTTGTSYDAQRDRTGDERSTMEDTWRDAPGTTKFGRDDWHDD
jgi:hypothetical protein